LQKRDLTIYGDGNQTRSFCYVEDLINGLVSLFFAENIYEPVNLGNPEPVTMKQLAIEILQLTSSSSTLVYSDLPFDDPKDRQPDIVRARELLGWNPKISRIDGLKKTIDYFDQLLKVELKQK
jgi:dTDP-glucose 4,6-dehydratase